MRSSSPIALSSSPSTVIVRRGYNVLLAPPSIRNASRSPKHPARLSNADVILLCEASRFLQVSCFSDIIEDRQYGGIRTRDQTRLDNARKRRVPRRFRTPPPKPSPPNTTVALFTSYFSGDRYKGTYYASAPDHESPLASPCERILCIRQRKLKAGVLHLPPPDQAPKTNAFSLEGHSPTDQDLLRGRRRRSLLGQRC
jgi:hypothetical protein